MIQLVIDTATEAHSVALIDGGTVVAFHHEILSRGHAEALMPAVAAVLGDRVPQAILVDIGPGSFTGLRIGIAAARALALAWAVPVHGFHSLSLIAAPLFAADPGLARLQVVAEAGRGQLYVATLGRDLMLAGDPQALDALSAAAVLDPALPVAGPGAGRLPGAFAVCADAWPDARDAALLPGPARALPPEPLYVRPPDAVAA